MSNVSTCLWYEKDAEMAARFYVSLVPGSSPSCTRPELGRVVKRARLRPEAGTHDNDKNSYYVVGGVDALIYDQNRSILPS